MIGRGARGGYADRRARWLRIIDETRKRPTRGNILLGQFVLVRGKEKTKLIEIKTPCYRRIIR